MADGPWKPWDALTPRERDLYQQIEQQARALEALVGDVNGYLVDPEGAEKDEINEARRWTAIGRTHFQEGLSALRRAVTRPWSF